MDETANSRLMNQNGYQIPTSEHLFLLCGSKPMSPKISDIREHQKSQDSDCHVLYDISGSLHQTRLHSMYAVMKSLFGYDIHLCIDVEQSLSMQRNAQLVLGILPRLTTKQSKVTCEEYV